MTNSMVLVKTDDTIHAAGNQEMIESLLPILESTEIKNIKAERDIYKMRVEMREPDWLSLLPLDCLMGS